MPGFGELNLVAVLVAAAASAALGALWYSPLLFRDAYVEAVGRSPEDLASPAALAGSVLSCLVAAFAVALLVEAAGVETALAGAGLGALLGLGVVAMTMLSDSLFSGWGWRLYLIQTSYRAGYLVLMGAILGAGAG